MPTIPTPFIGGADSPQRDTPAKREFAPPYHPGLVEPAEAIEPAEEHEVAEEAWESSSAEEVQAIVESVPAPSETVERELEPEEPEGVKPWEAEIDVAEPQEAEPAQAIAAEVETVEGEPSEFPSFLFGADGAGVDDYSAAEVESEVSVLEEEPAEAPEPATRYETAERLAEVARELLASDEGPRIQELIDELRRLTADIAVPRAFAAGYLAAQRRQEK